MSRNRIGVAQASALAVVLALAGCGEGSGVMSTPAPSPSPSPTPTPASYTKLSDMTGDRTFQTAGVQYNMAGSAFTNGTAQSFGTGLTIAYKASTDSYTVTAPDGSTATFGPADINAPPPLSGSNTKAWGNSSGTLTLTVPIVNGVALSYTIVGAFANFAIIPTRLAVGGVPTIASDMPRTGSAIYSTATLGNALQNNANYMLFDSSSTFSANFDSNSVTTSLTLVGTTFIGAPAPVSFGTFNGTGTISSTGPGFGGTLSGNGATGVFSGAFFGPQAAEMGYAWFLSGSNFSATGTTTGIKQ